MSKLPDPHTHIAGGQTQNVRTQPDHSASHVDPRDDRVDVSQPAASHPEKQKQSTHPQRPTEADLTQQLVDHSPSGCSDGIRIWVRLHRRIRHTYAIGSCNGLLKPFSPGPRPPESARLLPLGHPVGEPPSLQFLAQHVAGSSSTRY